VQGILFSLFYSEMFLYKNFFFINFILNFVQGHYFNFFSYTNSFLLGRSFVDGLYYYFYFFVWNIFYSYFVCIDRGSMEWSGIFFLILIYLSTRVVYRFLNIGNYRFLFCCFNFLFFFFFWTNI